MQGYPNYGQQNPLEAIITMPDGTIALGTQAHGPQQILTQPSGVRKFVDDSFSQSLLVTNARRK